MPSPSPEEQVAFLTKIQRLLAEGGFVSSYKFALLLALADLSVELGDDSGAPLLVRLDAVAEKVAIYYWRQAVPFPSRTAVPAILAQNTDRQATILQRVYAVHVAFAGSLVAARAQTTAWRALVSSTERTIMRYPLPRLQQTGEHVDEFLYASHVVGGAVELKPGVAFCFRKFHELIENVVRGAWVRFVRRVRANQELLGQAKDLDEFLFGSERGSLAGYEAVLRPVQGGRCFYCDGAIAQRVHVDHFIPWARYPVDLGHNFVLAHETCNGAKSDMLAAVDHLERWCQRNEEHGSMLAVAFTAAGLPHDLQATTGITRWAYQQAATTGSHVWIAKRQLESLDPRWRMLPGMAA